MDKQNVKKNNFLTAEDMERGKALMKECKELKKQLEERISKAQGRSGFSMKDLKEFFEIKDNFSEQKWDAFQQDKERFDSAFKGFKNFKSAAKKSSKSTDKKKAKKLGNRSRQREGWLPL